MTLSLEFTKLNDQYVRITGLHDGLTEAFKNTATVTATLKTKAGVAVTGFTNISMSYEAASDGVYVGAIPETFDAAKGSYVLWIDAVQTGIVGHWELPCRVVVRNTLD